MEKDKKESLTLEELFELALKKDVILTVTMNTGSQLYLFTIADYVSRG